MTARRGPQTDRKDRAPPARPLTALAPHLPPQIEPLLEPVRSDDDTVVGKIDQFIDGRVVTRPLRPVAAVRIAGLGERYQIGAGQFAHLPVVAGHFIAENFRWDIEDEGKLRTVQRALHFAALRLSHVGKTVEIGGTAGASDLVGKITRRFDVYLVAKYLLLQFVERLIALRVVEFSRLARVSAEDCKQFVLALRRTLSVVAVSRTDHDRRFRLAAGGEHKFRRLNDKLAVEHRSSHAEEGLARRKCC